MIELVAKQDSVYRHTQTSAAFLDPRSPACVAAAVRFMGDPMLLEPFSRLDEIVRTGRSTLPGDGSVEPDNPVWVEFAHSMAPMMGPMAGPLGEIAAGRTFRPAAGARYCRRPWPVRH